MGSGYPLVKVFLDDFRGNLSRLDNPCEPALAGEEVKRLLLEHGPHATRQWGKPGMMEHSELVLSIPVYKSGVGEKIEPVIDRLIEGSEEAIPFKGPPLQELSGLQLSGIAEMGNQEVAHLPFVAHLAVHDPEEALEVIGGGCRVDKVALLLRGSELRVSLVNDQVQERITYILGRNL